MKAAPSALVPVFALVCMGIVYGSLFPFRFLIDIDATTLGDFLTSWRTVTDTADILGNLALFFPYGYMACLIAGRSGKPGRSALSLGVLALFLAISCQIAQLFTVGRDPSIFDLYINGLGVALGWTGALIVPLGSRGKVLGGDPSQHLILVIAGSWLACQLLPFVPSFEIQSWKDALKPLLLYPRLRWQEALLQTVSWLVFFHMLHFHVGLRLRAPMIILGGVAVLALQVIIVRNYLTLSATLALVTAIMLWQLHARRVPGHWLAWALLIAFALDVLAPLTVRAAPRDFGWLPFGGYLRGSMLINATALCRKVFVFGALALLLVEPGKNVARWALAIALLLLLLEMLQRWIGFGTPALTDPLLFLALTWLINKQLARYRGVHVAGH